MAQSILDLQKEKDSEPPNQSLIQLQGNLVNKLIKRVLKNKIVTSEFKKEYSKALSIFILYVQNAQTKKKYSKEDILMFLEREGFGRVAEDIRKQRVTSDEPQSRKKQEPA